jgi:hypothetical protein
LPVSFEASDDLGRVHAWLDDLEGHAAVDWLVLLGHIDNAEAAFADLLRDKSQEVSKSKEARKRTGGRIRSNWVWCSSAHFARSRKCIETPCNETLSA